MNILIVCLQGMTSGVMARRMNAIAEERGDPYVFKSVGCTKMEEASAWADGVLLTPQASAHHAQWEQYLKQHRISYWKLNAFTMSFDHIPETYDAVISLISAPSAPKESLLTIMAKDLLEQLILCGAVIVFGWFMLCLHKVYPMKILKDAFQLTADSVCIYASLLSGRQYASHQKKSTSLYMMLSFIILLMLTPVKIHPQYGLVTQSFFMEAVKAGYYQPAWLILYLPVCPLFMLVYDVMEEKIQHQFMVKKLAPTHLWIDAAVPGTLMIILLLLIRIVTALIISA